MIPPALLRLYRIRFKHWMALPPRKDYPRKYVKWYLKEPEVFESIKPLEDAAKVWMHDHIHSTQKEQTVSTATTVIVPSTKANVLNDLLTGATVVLSLLHANHVTVGHINGSDFIQLAETVFATLLSPTTTTSAPSTSTQS